MKIEAIDNSERSPMPVRSESAFVDRVRGEASPFREILEVRQAYEVRGGDTLSQIVARELKGLGIRASGSEIYRGVARVVKANGIDNADLIRVGQRIDLSALSESRPGTAKAPRVVPPAPLESTKPTPVSLANVVSGSPKISSAYGMRHDPLGAGMRFHKGIDVAAHYGSAIRPLGPGQVVASGWRRGYGNVVVVRHRGGVETLYAHNSRNLVRVGERVSTDSTIALVGSSGRATGPHVHIEMRKDGRAIDPHSMRAGPLRLSLRSS